MKSVQRNEVKALLKSLDCGDVDTRDGRQCGSREYGQREWVGCAIGIAVRIEWETQRIAPNVKRCKNRYIAPFTGVLRICERALHPVLVCTVHVFVAILPIRIFELQLRNLGSSRDVRE